MSVVRRGCVVAAIFALALLAVGLPHEANAQAATTSLTTKDPSAITFNVHAPSALRAAKFDYLVKSPTRTNPDNAVGGSGDSTIAGTDASFTLQTNSAQRYIPVGSIFKYHWTLTANDGSQSSTPDQDYVFLDGRFTWTSQQDGQVTVYYYGGNDAAATNTLRASKASLDDTGKLLEQQVPYPIRLVVYKSEDEGRPAKRPTSPTFDATVQTGGQRVASDLILVFANNTDVVRHETAHIVTHVAGDGPFTSLPSWLDEGTAVYEQTAPGPDYLAGLNFAISSDQTIPLRSLQTAVSQPQLVNGFYGQSWSTVKFMVDTYSQPKYAQLFRTIYGGSRIDDALKTVYSLDQDGLYNAWRVANKLKPVAVQEQQAATGPVATGTRPPLGLPSSGGVVTGETPAAGAGGATSGGTASGPSKAVGIAVLIGAIAIAGALGGGGLYLLRSRRG